jgi:hypothetical protein
MKPFVCLIFMRRVRVPAQGIEGNQDGAGNYNNGDKEEHCSLRHRDASDLGLMCASDQRYHSHSHWLNGAPLRSIAAEGNRRRGTRLATLGQ